ncbi:MAG: hypothetical protein A2104_03940 [Candidatus Melainabacteria bacterium GWF2_32_7]|nr:MAG: hypothetical protein A2104_03940 [Candidatus Melainabacteria bacterium GWF2_32_7]
MAKKIILNKTLTAFLLVLFLSFSSLSLAVEDAVQNYIEKGNTALKYADYNDAIENYNKAASIDPNNAQIYFYLGNTYNQLAESESYNEYWGIYSLNKDHGKAVKYYEKALTLNSNFTDARIPLAGIYTDLGSAFFDKTDFEYSSTDLHNAEKHYRKALSYYPDYPEALLKLGAIYSAFAASGYSCPGHRFNITSRGCRKLAQEYFVKAQSINPGYEKLIQKYSNWDYKIQRIGY